MTDDQVVYNYKALSFSTEQKGPDQFCAALTEWTDKGWELFDQGAFSGHGYSGAKFYAFLRKPVGSGPGYTAVNYTDEKIFPKPPVDTGQVRRL